MARTRIGKLESRDKEIDRELKRIIENLKRIGIKATKTDAIRWILHIKKQGKKTNRNWRNIL